MAGRILTYKDYMHAADFAVDTVDEIAYLPTTEAEGTGIFAGHKKRAMGSTCIVGNEDGDLLVYMLFSFGWKQI